MNAPATLPTAMAVTDRRPAGETATAFVESLAAFANDWWRARGTGCAVSRASYADDIATIETRPGPAAITLADVRAAFRRKDGE